ncbi:MAG: serine/threonine-protein kinase, partial [Holophagae bacterium]
MNDTIPPDEPLPTQTGDGGETVDAPPVEAVFVPGTEVGGRYRIYSRLGAGGMGEVWHAFDLKLRVDVALKALRPDLLASRKRRELLRQEVRAAREVVSPNVCRIFDLIEIDGRELVSMEYVDGRTLLDELRTRGPLELEEARDVAAQFLAGLEAIHTAGLVHRDIKPENIMLTRTGRVVVMDFGLARQQAEGGGSVSGTPAYMAPEQAAGQTVDARADVYSAGVVLAEMVSPDGIRDLDSRKSLWQGVRSEPPTLPDSPWAPVIETAVARDREDRYHSAHTLTRALEEVAQRVAGADDVTPYPGLASFTEADAEFFFGREAEIEQMWRLLEGPPRLLGIMGPSGAGKTSFIRAGLTPNAPSDWSAIWCTPGNAAIASLRGALTSELPGGSETLRRLVTDPDNPDVIVDAVSRWSEEHGGAVIFVDQFEELFTLNAGEEQRRYAALLGRLPIEANVHVVLSMRDDFAASCNRHEALRPVFRELTVLDPPAGGNLRRALMQPATKCGYLFEDDALVDGILAEVEGERGALPLLAFALARLWEKRDRDNGLLTRQAYHDIGGVGGALARHAESTIDRIGVERIPIVREVFRNLITAEGTRAVREVDELLSVFEAHEVRKLESEKVRKSALPAVDSTTLEVRRLTSHSERSERSPLTATEGSGLTSDSSPARHAAAEVLRTLIDARLLTSYEVREEEHEPIRRVEIIHESLLANWPRLVRWQTQDADAAQVREQLRQAAKTWNEHGRSDDTLWTGATYREFASWRERYPGGLTELEGEFARAMTNHARRRTRRRRLAVAAALLVAAVTAAVFAGLWQRSEQQTRRAEGARLLAMARMELERDATKALAWATASLELADTPEARRFAVETLWRGPTRFEVKPVEGQPRPENIAFSPDGTYLAANSFASNELLVWSEDGGEPRVVGEVGEKRYLGDVIFSTMPTGESVLAQQVDATFALWSVPGLELLREFDTEGWDSGEIVPGRLILWSTEDPQRLLHVYPLDGA